MRSTLEQIVPIDNEAMCTSLTLREQVSAKAQQGVEAQRTGVEIHLEAKIGTYLTLVERTLLWCQMVLQVPILAMICMRSSRRTIVPAAMVPIAVRRDEADKKPDPGGMRNRQSGSRSPVALATAGKDSSNTFGGRAIWYLIAIIISGIIAPPDMISQVIIATPIIFLYEITVCMACVSIAFDGASRTVRNAKSNSLTNYRNETIDHVPMNR